MVIVFMFMGSSKRYKENLFSFLKNWCPGCRVVYEEVFLENDTILDLCFEFSWQIS